MAICLEHTMLTYLNNAHMLYLENYKSDPKTDSIFVLRDLKNGNIRWFQRQQKHFLLCPPLYELCSKSQDIVS